MNTTIRALNDQGVGRFRSYLEAVSDGGDAAPPFDLLEDPLCTHRLEIEVGIDRDRDFADKLEFGRYLAEVLEPLRSGGALERHVGLWSWLALCYFDLICPANAGGNRNPKRWYQYILSQDFKHHYRHLVRTPCLVYALHGENSRIVLSGPLHTHGEASEQILSRDQLFTNHPLFEAMDRLYIETGPRGAWHLKRGARGRLGGSLRRLGKIVKQFDLTYDLRAMTGTQILSLLPAEFDSFRT